MKSLILLCSAGIITVTASAQSPAILQSQSVYEITGSVGTLMDTLVHIHHAGRVSTPAVFPASISYPGNGDYNEDTTLQFRKDGTGYINDGRYTRTFNTSGLPLQYKWERIAPPSTQFSEVYRSETVYNSALLPHTITQYNAGSFSDKTVIVYNAAKQPDTISYQNASGTQSRALHTYQNGILLAKTNQSFDQATSTWKNTAVDSFITNGADSVSVRYNLGGPTIQQVKKNKYQRDANKRVLVDSAYSSGSFSRVTYSQYNTQGRLQQDSVIVWNAFPPGPKYSHKGVYHYDNNVNLLSRRAHQWNTDSNKYVSIYIDSMEYNGANQLTSSRDYLYVKNKLLPAEMSFWSFYYYAFPTSVSEIAKDEGIRLYPVPAASYINLQMSFIKPEPFTVRIFDMQGKLLQLWNEPAQAVYTKQVSLVGIPSGNYILHVFSAGTSTTRQFSVVQ